MFETSIEQNNDNNTKKKRIKLSLIKILSTSTSHGLPNIIRTERTSLKIMWLIFFIASLIFGVYICIKSIQAYLDHQFITQIDVIYELPSEFPSVTFFNLRDPKAKIPLNEILVECFFNDDLCDSKDFDLVEDSQGFISYRFNGKYLFTAGKINGLQLILFYGSSSTQFKNYTQFDGFQIVIHNRTMDPGYYAGFASGGIDIAAGYATNLVVNRVFTYKLEEPYNNCIKDVSHADAFDSELFKFILTNTSYSYTQKYCFDYCIGRELIKQCLQHVFNQTDHVQLNNWLNIWLLYSSYSNSTTECFLQVYKSLTSHDVNKVCLRDCPLECDSIKYDVSISFSRFPNIYYAQRLMNSFDLIKSKISSLQITQNDLSKQMISFNVYYNDLKYTIISQIPQTKMIDLVSKMGGLFGLFIGISFVSLAELIECILEVLFVLIQK